MSKIKVSDFKLAESIIRFLCERIGKTFIDIPITFDKPNDGMLFISGSKNIAHTLYLIISEYINKSYLIVGESLLPVQEDRDNFLLMIANNLRYFIYKSERFYSQMDDMHVMYLYQKPLVWIIMKDIVCPIFDRPLKNIKLVCGETPQVDIAQYYKDGEVIASNGESSSFIFINNIDNQPVQNAILLIEVLKAFELSPLEVMTKIYNSDLYDKFRGLLDLSMSEDEIVDFESTIIVALGMDSYDSVISKFPVVKSAQRAPNSFISQWWNMGILEKAIEPLRGGDWSVYKNLEPYVKQFWDSVEEVRKKRKSGGRDVGVPFDMLLRLKEKQTVDFKIDPKKSIQGLLSSDRVW